MSSNIKPKFLLTGAAGALGSAIRAEAKDDCEIVGLDLQTGGDSQIHQASFTDAAAVEPLIEGCDAVIHTAAMHGGHRNTHTPTQYTEVNVGGMVTLLELCVKHGVKRFVFSSTMEVIIGYDWAASGMAAFDEGSTPDPDWIYPATKLACEQMGLYYFRRHGIAFAALRYQGFDANYQPSPQLLARYIMPRDVARANLLAATVPDLAYEVFHIGPDTPLTQHDIIAAASAPYAVVEKYWPGATSILKAHNISLNLNDFWPVARIEKAKRMLGWQPQTTFETYLQSLGWKRDGD
jgi:UDP-glucose 4-epimerase